MKEIILKRINHVFNFSAEELLRVVNELREPIYNIASILAQVSGHIIVSGCGKSGIVAKKFVATLNSIGVPSIFIHASDASHGDLGVVRSVDYCVFISKSGNTKDLVFLSSLIKNKTINICAIVNNIKADLLNYTSEAIIIDAYKESDKLNVVPTTSIVLQLAVCDALALAIQEMKSLGQSEFSANHPSGTLGNLTNNKVQDLAELNKSTYVLLNDPVKNAIYSTSKGKKGATVVLEGEIIVGIITDGDIRRMLECNESITDLKCKDIMTMNPKLVNHDEWGSVALSKMNKYEISQLIVVKNGVFHGLIHLHDLLN